MIAWKDSYSTGNEAIDRQHKMLFEFFNDFEIVINDGKGAVYLNKCLPMLEAYAQSHFKFEEGCMHEHRCPVAQKNKMAHQIFLAKVNEYKRLYDAGGLKDDFFVEMHGFIERWIINHIIGIDTHLKECIK